MPLSKTPQHDALLPVGEEALEAAIALLERGRIVAVPTETVYGLAADATSGTAVASIYAAKGRPQFNPLISHVDGLEMALKYAVFDARAEKMAELFWPGSLTIVLSRQPNCEINELVTAGLDTIALRCPDHTFTQSLIAQLKRPLAAPSANPSGRLSPTDAEAVREAFSSDDLPLVVDGGSCTVGLESTIVSCVPGKPLIILRPGAVTLEELQLVFGPHDVRDHTASLKDQAQPAAPGMLLSHYAPKAALKLVSGGENPTNRDALLTFAGAALSADDGCDPFVQRDLSPTGDMKEAASNLFSMLRELDAFAPETIYVISPPCTGLGVAIHDRLQRAAAPRIKDTDIRES